MDKECRNLENELKIMRIRSVSDQLSRTIARELDSEEQQTRYGYVNRYTFAMAAVFCVAAIIISVISYHAITVPKLPIPPPPPPPHGSVIDPSDAWISKMIDVEDEGIVVTDPYNPVRRIRYRLFDRIKKHDLHHNTDMDIHILKENVIFIKQATY